MLALMNSNQEIALYNRLVAETEVRSLLASTGTCMRDGTLRTPVLMLC